MKEKIYILIGGKWFDKVNGNTYYKTKVIEVEGDKVVGRWFSGFAYGYGSCYYVEVMREIKEKEGQEFKQVFIDGGSFYLTKKEVVKGWF